MAGRTMYIMRPIGKISGNIFSYRLYHQHRISKLFQPLNLLPESAVKKYDKTVSLSQKLLVDRGIISSRTNGMFAVLPLGQRVLNKLIAIIDEELTRVGCYRITLPHLTQAALWKKTGRLDSISEVMFRTKDRQGREYVLSPTHEEEVTDLVSNVETLSYRELPIRLYQITSKFRDEPSTRHGLLRCKEFLMKDLYTFDKSEEEAICTYNDVSVAYDRIFKRIGVPFIKVAADSGDIGGDMSHEYHYPAAIGADTLLQCQACGYSMNSELLPNSDEVLSCTKCDSQMERTKGIEVGHTFLLGTKYSKTLKAIYCTEQHKPQVTWMGCYGVGVSRIMGAAVEVLCRPDSIIWPWMLAPFKVCIIGPKKGSRESNASTWVEHLADVVSKEDGYKDDVIIDDRDKQTIGRRVLEATRTGYPFIIVVGKKANENIPMFELIDTVNQENHYFSHKMLIQYLRDIQKQR